MTTLRLPDVRITEAVENAPNQAPTADVHVAHCRITGTIGREIHFAVLLPDAWNGRFMMGGGGGYVGTIQNSALASVDRGYATAGTDTGHQSLGTSARWALDNVERQLNFAYLGIHRTAEVAKAIIRAYYDADSRYSYFVGCSTGGRQALMEAQRFPEDFNGIVSGAPVYDWTRALANGLKFAQAMFPDSHALDHSVVTPENLKLLDAKALEACDAADGAADGIIDDPNTCRFDLSKIPACANDAAGPDCLTAAQRAAIARVYAPLEDAQGLIYEGQPVGGEAAGGGWRPWITGINDQLMKLGGVPSLSFGFSTEYFRNFVFADPSWDYTTYDIARNWRRDTRQSGIMLNADNPDLGALKARHGKLLLWHGWADPALNPRATIRYLMDVRHKDSESESYVQLFLLPGVLHCGGGNGPDRVDWMNAIADWVEKDAAPTRLIATKRSAAGDVLRSRPVCPYPQHAVYSGSGSTDEAANFVCR
jgi:feruloyl esterase